MPVYDKLIINKFINGSFTEFKDGNLDVVMEDMISYIKKMGGSVEDTPNTYEIHCPYLWKAEIYKRFLSFGIKPMMPNDSKIYYSLS
jgi:hypothetical protein